MILRWGVIFFILAFPWTMSATHNRAGEITFRQTGSLTLEVTVTTYTKASSVAADRDSLLISWGDGFFESILRTNGNGQIVGNDIKKNLYVGTHTYPAQGQFTISMTDPNRIDGIRNVNYPNSVVVPFYIETQFTFTNAQFQGFNNSPQLLQAPIDVGCVGQVFRHNPNAFDPDGDSLAYELITPLQAEGEEVPRYVSPERVNPVGSNARLDPVTGDFVWITPRERGDYNIAILIKEYRNGQLINSIIRDMQIFIDNCSNVPPIVDVNQEWCILAGETLRFTVSATAPLFESDQKVSLTGLGGPLSIPNNPAQVDFPIGFQDDPVQGNFIWNTNCNHITKEPYTLVMKAEDDFFGDRGLADLKTVRIKVMGPPPDSPSIEAINGQVRVSWKSPYSCESTRDEYFRGFSVWRRQGSNPFIPDSCTSGLAGKGYTRIAFNQLTQDDTSYYYVDENNLERGVTYCYRILADFALQTPAGLPYNPVSSIPSSELCIVLGRDLPFMTQVDVQQTDTENGRIHVAWSKPNPDDLDTLQNGPPYVFELMRADGLLGADFQILDDANYSFNSFFEMDTLSYTDSMLNTSSDDYRYTLNFYTSGNQAPLGSSNIASNISLNTFGTDERVQLSWNEEVPWNNFLYEVYRTIPGSLDTLLLDSSLTKSYLDLGLINGESYCYQIRSFGKYNLPSFNDTLSNRSAWQCATAIDNLAPCKPDFLLENICLSEEFSFDESINVFSWSNPMLECEDSDDLLLFELYRSQDSSGNYEIIAELAREEQTYQEVNTDNDLSGCYFLVAIDSVGNRSTHSDTICVNNCPEYTLPNTFTPDSDGINEFFVPTAIRFISRIDMKIFNRWGNLVFETEDPMINWDGRDMDTGELLPNSTYFYQISIYYNTANRGEVSLREQTGFIDLIR